MNIQSINFENTEDEAYLKRIIKILCKIIVMPKHFKFKAVWYSHDKDHTNEKRERFDKMADRQELLYEW